VQPGTKSEVFSSGMVEEITRQLGEPSRRANIVAESSIVAGARVTAVRPFIVERPVYKGIGVKVELSDGSSVVVIPSPEEAPEPVPDGTTISETADWELHTPQGNLQVGPGLKWHFARSRHRDEPASAPSET
jgi:hypothetical protein